MNKFKIIAAAAGVAIAGFATSSSAATLGFIGGDSVASVPGNFGALRDINGPVATPATLTAPLTLFDGTASLFDGLTVMGGDTVKVTLTYLGFEAGNLNIGASLEAIGQSFTTTTSAMGDSISFLQDGGTGIGSLVSLAFNSQSNGNTVCGVVNGDYAGNPCQVAFSSIFSDGKSTYAMFGDGAGDSDLDDMVLRIDVSEVPLPAAAWLMLAGIGSLGAMRRLKKS